MKTPNNNWHSFSRGIAVFVLIVVTICGLCGLGSLLNQIPWFLIAGGICLLLILGSALWFLGYKSRVQQQPIVQQQPTTQQPTTQQPKEQVIILRKELTPEEFNKAYNLFADEDETSVEESISDLAGE